MSQKQTIQKLKELLGKAILIKADKLFVEDLIKKIDQSSWNKKTQNAAQALEFRRPLKSSPIIESFVAEYRKTVPFVVDDTILYKLIQKSVEFVESTDLAL